VAILNIVGNAHLKFRVRRKDKSSNNSRGGVKYSMHLQKMFVPDAPPIKHHTHNMLLVTDGTETLEHTAACVRQPEPISQRIVHTYEEIDFKDKRHESLILILSKSNSFYYTVLNFAMRTSRFKNDPGEKGILAFEGSKAVAFIIYTKQDDILITKNHLQPAIEIHFHLVDKNYRNKPHTINWNALTKRCGIAIHNACNIHSS
jgi:hypothetical protein